MSQGSICSMDFSDSEFSETDIAPALLKQIKTSPRQSIAVTQKRMTRQSVLTQTKRSTRIQEQEFFNELLDDSDFESDFGESAQRSDMAQVSSIRNVRDSQIDSLCLSASDICGDMDLLEPRLSYVRTKSGRGASLLQEGEDEHEKIGLIQYENGSEEMRRRQSFHKFDSDTFDEVFLILVE